MKEYAGRLAPLQLQRLYDLLREDASLNPTEAIQYFQVSPAWNEAPSIDPIFFVVFQKW